MRRAALVFNPAAGQGYGGRRLAAIEALLGGAFALEVRPTPTADSLRSAARDAAAAGVETLFVLGGDGTLRLAAGALLGSATALAPLPGGTTNVVACAALGLPRDPLAAARALVERGERRELDAGRLHDGGGAESLFLMQTSAGLDARVLDACGARAKRRFGKLAIAWAGVLEWLRYRFPSFELVVDGERTTATGFVATNLAEYAGRFAIVPGARADDGVLDLLLYRGTTRRAALGFALALAAGRHARCADVEIRRAERLVLAGPRGAVVQADGDAFAPALPLEVDLAPRRLLVLAPTRARGGAPGTPR